MPRVFISYKRDPSATLANLIKDRLELKHNIDAFLDDRDLKAGSFPPQLWNAIIKSDFFICVISNTTFDSKWVLQEIQHAFDNSKTMIPVFQESYTKPPASPSPSIQALLGSNGIQILDKRGIYIDAQLNRLANFIKEDGDNEVAPGGSQVRIEIVLNMPSVDVTKFLIYIAGIALVGINVIHLLGQYAGSVILYVEIPEDGAARLHKAIDERPRLFSRYNLKSFRQLSEGEEIPRIPGTELFELVVNNPQKTIFISYSSEDLFVADMIVQALTEQGYTVLWNRLTQPDGERARIVDMMIRADIFVFIIPRDNDKSREMLMPRKIGEEASQLAVQWSFARNTKKKSIPMILSRATTPIGLVHTDNTIFLENTTFDKAMQALYELIDNTDI